MTRLYLREPSALIPAVSKNISNKANTLNISQNKITLISKLLKNIKNMQEFFSWKEKEESKSFLYFSKQRGNSSTEIGSNMYHVCQHDGHSKAHEPDHKTNERYNHGRIKRDTFCPSRMNVKLHESDSTVSVTYIRANKEKVSRRS